MIEMIALLADNGVCSIDGKIPVVLKAHLEKFREVICGKTIVMGNKTFKSIGEKTFSLADETIVLTRNGDYYPSNVTPMNSLVQIMDAHKDFTVIGGVSTFCDFMPIADRLYITEVAETASGDKFKLFPKLRNFRLMNPGADMLEEDDHYYRLLEYKRK